MKKCKLQLKDDEKVPTMSAFNGDVLNIVELCKPIPELHQTDINMVFNKLNANHRLFESKCLTLSREMNLHPELFFDARHKFENTFFKMYYVGKERIRSFEFEKDFENHPIFNPLENKSASFWESINDFLDRDEKKHVDRQIPLEYYTFKSSSFKSSDIRIREGLVGG